MGQLVVRVACGAHHCAALTAQGALFTWGGNGSGQLGHGDTAQLSRRRRVAALEREQVERVACGRVTRWRARRAVTHGWGSHEFGQLGVGGGEGAEQSGVTLLDAMRCALLPVPLPPPAGAVAWAEAACGEAPRHHHRRRGLYVGLPGGRPARPRRFG